MALYVMSAWPCSTIIWPMPFSTSLPRSPKTVESLWPESALSNDLIMSWAIRCHISEMSPVSC